MDTITRIFELADQIFLEQQAFAAAIGVSPKTVSVWRNGRGKSYMKYLPQISAALHTNVEYLLTGKESSPPSEEDRLLAGYDALSARNREKLEEYLDLLLSSQDRP